MTLCCVSIKTGNLAMKIFKNIYIAAAVVLAGGVLASCSSSKDEPNNPGTGSGDGQLVTIRTNIVLNTKSALIKEFSEGQAMNVYAKAYGAIDAADLISGVKATRQGANWVMSPEVRVKDGQNVFLYAFYPYNSANVDPTKIPVDINTQTDFLYSGNYVPASFTTHTVTLNMKHAQSMIAFNVKKEGYSGEGHITSIKLTSDKFIVTKGTLNVNNGAITATGYGSIAAQVSATAGAQGISGVLPAVWAAPFNTLNTGATVVAVLTIDGKEYSVALPEVSAQRGWQYIFHCVLTKNGLAIVPEATEQYALDMSDDEFSALTGHGVVTFSHKGGKEFLLPSFAGNNIFGNVVVNDKSYNYAEGSKVVVDNASEITVETWNSTGFSLSSIEKVDRIDLSAYK